MFASSGGLNRRDSPEGHGGFTADYGEGGDPVAFGARLREVLDA